MNRICPLLICLLLTACLQSVTNLPTAAPTAHLVRSSGQVLKQDAPTVQATQDQSCAIVTATRSLWLRADAGTDTRALAWLAHDHVVEVIDTTNSAWWKVHDPESNQTGYARASFLKIISCQGDQP